MEYSKVKALYLEQIDTISKLFDNKEFVSLLSQNDLLKTNFVDQISILKYLEKKLSDTSLIKKEIDSSKKNKKIVDLIEIEDLNKSDIYMKKFKEVTATTAEFNNFEDVKKVEDIKDTIKFLNVFLQNTFKKDLNYFLSNKPNETLEAEQLKKKDDIKNPTNENNNNVVNPNFGSNPSMGAGFDGNPMFGNGMFTGGGPNLSYETWKEQQITTAAIIELRRQISTGQFYVYKTKPKIMVYLKNVLGTLLMLAALIWILVLVTQSLALSFQTKNSGGALWYGSSDKSYIPLNLGSTFFTYIVYAFSIIYFLFVGYRFLVNKKNENVIYGFDKKAAVLLIVLIIIQSTTFIYYLVAWIPHLNAVKNYTGSSSVTIGSNTYQATNSKSAVIAFEICTWSILSGLIFFVILIAGFVITWIYTPKEDKERIELKTQELIKQLKDSSQFKNMN